MENKPKNELESPMVLDDIPTEELKQDVQKLTGKIDHYRNGYEFHSQPMNEERAGIIQMYEGRLTEIQNELIRRNSK